MRAETCAFCLETQEVLGCFKWAFQVPADKNSALLVTCGLNKDTDFSKTPSQEFRAASQQWNLVAAKQKGWKSLEQPKAMPITGKTMGGSPALPPPPDAKKSK